MQKRKTTFRTFSQAIKNIGRRVSSGFLALVAAVAFTAQTPAPIPSLAQILKSHIAALAALHLRDAKTHETSGTLDGLGVHGAFHEWQDGDKQRRDETLGIRTQRVLRAGGHLWIQNSSGEIRELNGLVARRQITEDFIDSAAFASHPEHAAFLDRSKIADGRTVYHLRIAPPRGEEYIVGLDTTTFLIDEKSYIDGDAPRTTTYADYHVIDGLLVPYSETDSQGDRRFDLTSHVTKVVVN
ncbi:MAG: hypothetical protein M3R51_00320, partial [Candidatus Eremiobacteraeota bacterium]|nr:hypothetical protein [Candidatus Eremiobacteraeota bacterium]